MSARLRQLIPFADPNVPAPSWSDDRLVRACLDGHEQAWAALIEKYKRLIYSVPCRYGATPEDAADIFQTVCLELFSELPRLRKIESLRSWLITVAAHKSFHWKRKQRRQADKEVADLDQEEIADAPRASPELMAEVENEQIVREAVEALPSRCHEMIRLLFYEDPPSPYDQLAQRLGLATGSIGFIRGRCLKRLQKILEEKGF